MSANDKDKEKNNDHGGSGGHDDDHGGGHDKTTTIIVNTREKAVEGKEVTFDQIVRLAFENPPTGEFIEITINYRKGPGRDGSLQEGGTVKIKKGMIFDVTATDKS
jgi:Multiubiquitin